LLTIADLCYIAVFAAIIAVSAQTYIGMPFGVPITLQTFAVPLAGIVLGPKKGTIAVLIYVLLGAVGAPVFSEFTGGMGRVFGPTGGFILSFPLMALIAGVCSDLADRKYGNSKLISSLWLTAGLVGGATVNYICGMAFYAFVMPSDLRTAFTACVLPFIPTAIIKIVMLLMMGRAIKRALAKSGVMRGVQD